MMNAESMFEVEKSVNPIAYEARLRARIGQDVAEICSSALPEQITLAAPDHFHGRYNTCTALAQSYSSFYNAATVLAPALRRIIPGRPRRRSYGAC